MVKIVVSRTQHITLDPEDWSTFPFEDQDKIAILPEDEGEYLPKPFGEIFTSVPVGQVSIAVPPVYSFYEYRGFRIPAHLITLTGGGPEGLEPIGKAQIANLERHVGLFPEMSFLEVGCGIGRAALQLLDIIDERGRYIGIDVTRDSITWCRQNIAIRHPNFYFCHFDAFNEMYNPFGKYRTDDFCLPAADRTIDRIFLGSVFTHVLADEVAHYLREFARVLKPNGLVYACFFLYSAETITAAARTRRVEWDPTFPHQVADGVYANQKEHHRAAVAYTDAAMQRLIREAELVLDRPYLKGWWSGLYEEADDGQDVAILRLPP